MQMDSLSIIPRRQPTGPMGYLNYPAEIMNKIYEELFVDDNHILLFLCSTDPALRAINLKRSVDETQTDSGHLHWSQLYDPRYYVDSNGRYAQILRVCQKIWLEGSPVLYGNLKMAMRHTPRTDPCIEQFFKRNAPYVLAWAKIVNPESDLPWDKEIKGWKLFNVFHWGAAHPSQNWELDRATLRRIRDNTQMQKGENRVRSFSI